MMAIASSATMVTTIAMMPTFQPFASRLKDASVTPVDALGNDDARILQAKERDEQTDARRNRDANRLRNRLEDELAQTRGRSGG